MGCLDQNPPPFNNQQEYNVWLYDQLVALDGCVPDAPDEPDGCKPEQLEHKNFNNAQSNGVQPGEFYATTENGRPGETRVMVSEEFMGIEDGDSIWIECKEYTPDHYEKTDYPTSKYVKFYVPGDPDQFPAIGETVEVSDCDPECPESAPQMVFYGVKPPDEAPVGAIFTDENTIKSFVHQGEGVWIEHTPCVGDGEDGGNPNGAYINFNPSSETDEEVRVYVIPHASQYGIAVSTVYNNTGLYTERWEIDPEGDGNWGDARNDFTSDQRNDFSIGSGTSGWSTYIMGLPGNHGGNGNDPSTWPNPKWPNLKVRCKCFNDVDHDELTVYSEAVSPYLENHKK